MSGPAQFTMVSHLRRARPPPPCLENLFEHWQQRDEDDTENDFFEVSPHHRHLSQLIPENHHEANPERSAKQTEQQESRIRHLRHSRNERRAGADDRDEPRIDDRPRAVLLVENLRTLQVIGMKETRLRAAENARPA